ncbi:conserved hypothetical protein [Coccidioides posadasii str. Silveira]|uniref:Uncharacterized protein n=1 Tax=Coccidioides posadasii (strain RMSCC 757 / Silveira) TaxID=443226 RepID=E9CZC9_COCPS|nr:conserved hypothetical protein [Coccidioides posadasii str. Silveira]
MTRVSAPPGNNPLHAEQIRAKRSWAVSQVELSCAAPSPAAAPAPAPAAFKRALLVGEQTVQRDEYGQSNGQAGRAVESAQANDRSGRPPWRKLCFAGQSRRGCLKPHCHGLAAVLSHCRTRSPKRPHLGTEHGARNMRATATAAAVTREVYNILHAYPTHTNWLRSYMFPITKALKRTVRSLIFPEMLSAPEPSKPPSPIDPETADALNKEAWT